MSEDPTLDELLADERRCTLDRFDRQHCWDLGAALRHRLADSGSAAAVQITHAGVVAFAVSLDGASADNIAWLERKRNVVERFAHSSLWTKTMAGPTFHSRFRLPESQYAAVGGAFPLLVRGVGMVGTVALSGMASDVAEHELIVAAISRLTT